MNPTDYAKLIAADIEKYACGLGENPETYADDLIGELSNIFYFKTVVYNRFWVDFHIKEKVKEFSYITDEEWAIIKNTTDYRNLPFGMIRVANDYIINNIYPIIMSMRKNNEPH